jgi:lysophospholipase L1-like esterase
MRVGFNVVYPRSANLLVTGVWLSVDPVGYISSASRSLSDTTWPAWDTVDKTRSIDADLALSARLGALESPDVKAIESLGRALRNPLHSPMITLIGDSITSGTGAEYNGEGENNAKFNYAMRSWANLFRRYLGETYAEGAVIQNGSDGRYEKTSNIDMLGGDSRFKWILNASGRYIPAPNPSLSASAKFGKYVDFGRNYRLEFDLVGSSITFIHSQYVSANPDAVRIQVWDTLTNTLLGQFSWAGSSVFMGKESTVTFPFGRYRIQLRDASTGTEFNFRLEGLKVKQQIQVRNIGISGSNTIDWLPGSVNLNQVRATDEFLLVQLGTNDRVNTTIPLNYSKTKDNLEAIAKNLIASGKKVVLMCANVALGNKEGPENPIYNYSMNDVLRACRQVADKLGVDIIDNYTPTRKAVIDGQSILSDDLHPNNLGHSIIYSNILDRINRSRP